ncbi:hypothetical protein C2I18_13460 [Paenibacillus sp. PK3_47]|uniref:hypothetical protein n=1 Tax=Paenibacillus sp. PK3_47 TaxID=2072642 RepID=UPI00201D840B|nr:hypothetical protein [Paenibacillus sp. PK3_47]UQZ34438.1 hypothetical protein C2I18_13460 [Paenibacillus sp. PK3_47]
MNMNRAYRELFLNTTVISLVVSLIFAGIAASFIHWGSFVVSWGFDFLLIFLLVYFYNLVVSVLNFALAKLCRSTALRLALFNSAGLLLTALPAYKLEALYIFSLYASFVIQSAISVFGQKTADRT